MSEWRGRARSILGQGVERLRDGALQWVTRISREAAEASQSPEDTAPSQRPPLQRALGVIRVGVSMGRSGARRVRGRVGRTVRWAEARLPGALLAVVGRPQRAGASDGSRISVGEASVPAPRRAHGSVRSGFFSGPPASRRPGGGGASQLRAFGRDAWTLFVLWEVGPELRPDPVSAPGLELRIRALGGAEVLRRRVALSGSLYLEDLVPGATYVVELWWIDGTHEVSVAMPPESVTLAMGPPASGEAAQATSFGSWTAQDGAPLDGTGQGPALQSASPPAWAGSPVGHAWAGPSGRPEGSPTSAGGLRSGSGSGSARRASSPSSPSSPSSRGAGAGSGSGWAGSRTSPGASWQQASGATGSSGRAPTSPGSGRIGGAPLADRAVRAPGAWSPADVAALIRPGRRGAPPPPSPGAAAATQGPDRELSAAPTSVAAAAPTPTPAAPPTERPAKGGRRGRRGRRRGARQEAADRSKTGGGGAPEGASPRAETAPVRRGFFQEAPADAPRPPGRRRGR